MRKILVSGLLSLLSIQLFAYAEILEPGDPCFFDPEDSIYSKYEVPSEVYRNWTTYALSLPSDEAGTHPRNIASNFALLREYLETVPDDDWVMVNALSYFTRHGCYGLEQDSAKADQLADQSRRLGNVVTLFFEKYSAAYEQPERRQRVAFQAAIDILEDSPSWAFTQSFIESTKGISIYQTKIAGRDRYRTADAVAYCRHGASARDIMPRNNQAHYMLMRCYQTPEWQVDPVLAFAHLLAYHELSGTELDTVGFALERQLTSEQLEEARELLYRLADLPAPIEPDAAGAKSTPRVASASALRIVSTGTGFFLSNDLIATNQHVIEDAVSIEVFVSGKKFDATLAASDPDLDLAVLKIVGDDSDEAAACFDLKITATTPGTIIFAAGFPLSDVLSSDPKITSGVISSQNGAGDDPKTFQISAPIQPGNSGGPVFSQEGILQGVAVSTLTDTQNVNFAIKPVFLSALLASNGISPVCERPLSGEPNPIASFSESIALIGNLQ